MRTSRFKSRDFRLAQVQERSLQSREAMIGIYDLLASMLKAKEEQLKLAQGYYDDFPKEQQQAIVNESNGTDLRWRHDKESSEMLVYLTSVAAAPLLRGPQRRTRCRATINASSESTVSIRAVGLPSRHALRRAAQP